MLARPGNICQAAATWTRSHRSRGRMRSNSVDDHSRGEHPQQRMTSFRSGCSPAFAENPSHRRPLRSVSLLCLYQQSAIVHAWHIYLFLQEDMFFYEQQCKSQFATLQIVSSIRTVSRAECTITPPPRTEFALPTSSAPGLTR